MFYTSLDMTHQASEATPTHRGIIDRAGGPAAVGRKINVEPNTTKAWKRLDSIPAAHWQALAQAGIATLDELASAAARRLEAAQAEAA